MKKFIILLFLCMFLFGCQKKQLEINCSYTSEDNKNVMNATIVRAKDTYEIKSGKLTYSIDNGSLFSKEMLNDAVERIKTSFCGEKSIISADSNCQVYLEGTVINIEARLSPSSLALNATGRDNTKQEINDDRNILNYLTKVFGEGTTCKEELK